MHYGRQSGTVPDVRWVPVACFTSIAGGQTGLLHRGLRDASVAYIRECPHVLHPVLSQGSTVRLKQSDLHNIPFQMACFLRVICAISKFWGIGGSMLSRGKRVWLPWTWGISNRQPGASQRLWSHLEQLGLFQVRRGASRSSQCCCPDESDASWCLISPWGSPYSSPTLLISCTGEKVSSWMGK